MTQKRPASSWGRNEPVKRGNSSQLDTPATLQAFENRACKQEGGPDLLQGLKTLPLISRDTWTASFSRQENPPRDRCLKEELFSVVIHYGFQVVVVIFQYDSGLSAGKSSFGFKLGMLTVFGNNLFQCAKCFEIKLNNKNTRVLCKLLTMKPNSQDDT